MPFSIVPVKQEPAAGQRFFDAGGGDNFHTHTCAAEGEKTHTWLCNSPYCENMRRDCPEHGGKEPVTKGEEPWRG